MIWANLIRRLDAVLYLMKYVHNTRSTKEKSYHYRAALLILASIVEGYVYAIVRKNTASPSHYFRHGHKYSEVCKISAKILGTSNDVHLYRRESFEMSIDDEGATFSRLNLFLKHKRIINENQYKALEWIRRERNRLHIQGLTQPDVNYTLEKVKRASKAIGFLIEKL